MPLGTGAADARFDPERDDGPVPSPCLGVCALDAQRQYCVGCERTLSEIAAWRGLDEAGRRAVWRRLRAKMAAEAPPGP
ncbi:MAG TPA: DUF1289 domain-containing protein [Ottowia sp.]|uniref:DUF1289 domain-containing protein n=1 Tax=Ottowia sp. TaxID=1898956 RepID=UPI002C6A497D|nr:DUF1289 domain-containing protein [Ottowia sp.]HMN22182.1 DUF1289 domain-containing protein [Ottowia sp.]